MPGGRSRSVKAPLLVGGGEVRRRHDQDHARHPVVDVAADLHRAGLVEAHRRRRLALVERDLEGLGARERVDVVVDLVVVREATPRCRPRPAARAARTPCRPGPSPRCAVGGGAVAGRQLVDEDDGVARPAPLRIDDAAGDLGARWRQPTRHDAESRCRGSSSHGRCRRSVAPKRRTARQLTARGHRKGGRPPARHRLLNTGSGSSPASRRRPDRRPRVRRSVAVDADVLERRRGGAARTRTGRPTVTAWPRSRVVGRLAVLVLDPEVVVARRDADARASGRRRAGRAPGSCCSKRLVARRSVLPIMYWKISSRPGSGCERDAGDAVARLPHAASRRGRRGCRSSRAAACRSSRIAGRSAGVERRPPVALVEHLGLRARRRQRQRGC